MNSKTARRQSGRRGEYRLTPLAWQLAGLLMYSGVAQAEYRFSSALLQIGNTPQTEVDLALFSDEDKQPPGEYRVDLFLNEQRLDTRTLAFSLQPDEQGKERLAPCLKWEGHEGLWRGSGRLSRAAALRGVHQSAAGHSRCQNGTAVRATAVEAEHPAGGVKTPGARLCAARAVGQRHSGVAEQLYPAWGARSQPAGGGNESSYFVNLRNGANWGAWRLRHDGVWNRNGQGEAHWRTLNSYVQRDITPLNGLLTLGDATTPGDIFDSLPLRGVQLASVEEMYPDSLRGYSPVVRGIAKSNAEVIVRQNGVVVDQRYVPPGAFEISDLYAVSGSGDLDVIIKESDGTEQRLLVPFASLPVLQREGRLSYGLAAGHYRAQEANTEDAKFMQGTLIYGLPLGATLYGGGQWVIVTVRWRWAWGKTCRAGALSLDMTQSWAATGRGRSEGRSAGQNVASAL